MIKLAGLFVSYLDIIFVVGIGLTILAGYWFEMDRLYWE